MDIVKELNRRRTAAATAARSARAQERRIEAAADLLRAEGWGLVSPDMKRAGWEVGQPGPAMVVDREGDRWCRGRDGRYYLTTPFGNEDTPWTIEQVRESYGIREQA